MNKNELIAAVSIKAKITQTAAKDALNAAIETITDVVKKGEEVRLSGLFNLSVEHKPARPGRNPSTGETIQIAAKNYVKIKPAKELADAANK